ncbi:MFS general substrate transporter [Dichomitus squalens]|uniref:MFS general substrate transporter n=1 Tax=Dichomitus squalens TaxID=114155 RepID=A0A4Q9Q379_9APHY|nr:MFS general substrate transporter [Dichomitus squalens]TBU40638.1 MFS general substrate transporter [Dichomitus squalens]TBU61520.1 MFS general substrate transporter [Dichomitus squalens]
MADSTASAADHATVPPAATTEPSSKTPTFVESGERTESQDVVSQFQHEAYGPGPGEKPEDNFEMTMAPDDPDNPKTWSRPYRWFITMLSAVLVLNATFASSAPSGIAGQLIEHFHISREVATLTIALFVAGYCVGPLAWGPLSEQVGRKPVFVVCFFVYAVFQVGNALAPNTGSLLVFRFLGGMFAASPLANSGAVISDIWDADTRGKALALFTLAPFAGPSLGPTVSGFMNVAGVSWRWVFYLQAIFAGTCLAAVVLFLPETYVPILLVRRARQKRKETGDDRYWAPLERNKLPLSQRLKHILGRPFVVLFSEPMLLAITAYMSFVYGVVYLLFEAYPIVFTEGHHFNTGISGLMFLPIFVGGVAGVAIYLGYFNPRYAAAIKQYAPHPVPPEVRMEVCTYAAPIFALAFFWFGWTSYPSVSYWAPLMAGFPMGVSVVFIFLGLFNYTIDAYLAVAASALSAMTVVRSLFGAAFPLFATQMYDTLNPRWASTLLGCIALLMVPIPVVLERYGHRLRERSKYAPSRALPPKAHAEKGPGGEKAV